MLNPLEHLMLTRLITQLSAASGDQLTRIASDEWVMHIIVIYDGTNYRQTVFNSPDIWAKWCSTAPISTINHKVCLCVIQKHKSVWLVTSWSFLAFVSLSITLYCCSIGNSLLHIKKMSHGSHFHIKHPIRKSLYLYSDFSDIYSSEICPITIWPYSQTSFNKSWLIKWQYSMTLLLNCFLNAPKAYYLEALTNWHIKKVFAIKNPPVLYWI